MIEKIISMGSSSVSRAAARVAKKFDIVHDLKDGEADSDALDNLLEKPVETSDGTLYFIQNQQVTSHLEEFKKEALHLNKPLIVLDLARESGFFASQRIASWIAENRIRALQVAGDGDLEVDKVSAIADILEATFLLSMMETDPTSPQHPADRGKTEALPEIPATINDAKGHLQRSLSLKEKALIANMNVEELPSINPTLGDYINTHFDLFTDNKRLLDDCRKWSGQMDLLPKDAAPVIIRALWEHLRETCRIRVVK